ncbi:molybdate ABC transporter substrate-binding protein [Stenotrophomonas pictorum JCM 9942]|uniref:Molybdate ABC transporter substrate-binding protein n=1 Tax=Stenotrophomonas pictorum JCM 9942 TaxID=1236960 RepID=A0A0R0AGD9_9GAMM|nr:molybdate ABC transporter substrate-binding protein [Stenotrophomonas pictorum]KRG43967.1 molybdate ABC transporter substrate-binding protein [Stenotrophomonas pictorum JCM 9942]
MNTLLSLVLMFAAIPAAAVELTVSAASSLTESFREIAAAYEAVNPDIRVDLNFAASGVLLQQIARGAPVDVFASADQATMALAAQRGLVVPATRQIFAVNSLWVVVPPQARGKPASLVALAEPGVRRITIGNPDSVPAGRYAREVLQQAGLWQALQPRMINTQNVRQSLDYVARGEVDAGFVYATDAQAMPGRVHRAFQVPVPGGISYPLAMVRTTRSPAHARAFMAFVRSAQGQAILRRHGFGSP